MLNALVLIALAAATVVAPLSGAQVDSIGDGGRAVSAILRAPEGVALDAAGNVYVSERAGHRVRRVDAATGIITTYAGTGESGFTGDGGSAREARLALPTDLAIDAAGDLYIAEPANHRIRRVEASSGRITTFAGTGQAGFSGDGGAADQASLNAPFGVSVAPDGRVYISDTDNHRIRRVDPSGVIETVAGNGTPTFGGDGGPATAASLARPHRVVVTPAGDLLIGDSFNHRIRMVDAATGVIRTIAGTGRMGAGGDGGSAIEASITYSGGLALDAAGALVFTDLAVHRVRSLDLESGIITTIAGTGRWDFGGDGGPALAADLHLPGSIVRSANGDLVFADKWNGRVRRISRATGGISTVAGGFLNEPTPEVSYHFHYDGRALRRDLDAPVAVGPTDADRLLFRRLEIPVPGRDEPLALGVHLPPSGASSRPPAIVLVHGRANHEWDPLDWGGLTSWARLIASRGLAAVVVSHRLGSTPRSLEDAAADLEATLAALDPLGDELDFDARRTCLVSFGGGSTLLAPLVDRPPERVRCLALFSPHSALEPPALWDWYMEAGDARARHSLRERIGAESPPLFLAVGAAAPAAITEPFDAVVRTARDRGVQVEVARHPTGDMDFDRHMHDADSRRIIEQALAFLERWTGAPDG